MFGSSSEEFCVTFGSISTLIWKVTTMQDRTSSRKDLFDVDCGMNDTMKCVWFDFF